MLLWTQNCPDQQTAFIVAGKCKNSISWSLFSTWGLSVKGLNVGCDSEIAFSVSITATMDLITANSSPPGDGNRQPFCVRRNSHLTTAREAIWWGTIGYLRSAYLDEQWRCVTWGYLHRVSLVGGGEDGCCSSCQVLESGGSRMWVDQAASNTGSTCEKLERRKKIKSKCAVTADTFLFDWKGKEMGKQTFFPTSRSPQHPFLLCLLDTCIFSRRFPILHQQTRPASRLYGAASQIPVGRGAFKTERVRMRQSKSGRPSICLASDLVVLTCLPVFWRYQIDCVWASVSVAGKALKWYAYS